MDFDDTGLRVGRLVGENTNKGVVEHNYMPRITPFFFLLLLGACNIIHDMSKLTILQSQTQNLKSAQMLSAGGPKQIFEVVKVSNDSNCPALETKAELKFSDKTIRSAQSVNKSKSGRSFLFPQFNPSHFKCVIQKAKNKVINVLERPTFIASKEIAYKTARVSVILIIAICFLVLGLFLLISTQTPFYINIPFFGGRYWAILDVIVILCFLIGLILLLAWAIMSDQP